MHVTLTKLEKANMIDKIRTLIVLCLGDKILRKVTIYDQLFWHMSYIRNSINLEW